MLRFSLPAAQSRRRVTKYQVRRLQDANTLRSNTRYGKYLLINLKVKCKAFFSVRENPQRRGIMTPSVDDVSVCLQRSCASAAAQTWLWT